MNEQALANGWYVARESELVGPLSDSDLSDRLRRGLLGRDDYAWREGMELWMQLKDLPGLGSSPRVPPPGAASRADERPRSPGTVPPAQQKPQQAARTSTQQRRGEAATRLPPVPAPAGQAKSPWQLPQGGAKDLLTEAAKRVRAGGFKLPPLAIALIVMGFLVPPLAIPFWLLAFVVYLRAK